MFFPADFSSCKYFPSDINSCKSFPGIVRRKTDPTADSFETPAVIYSTYINIQKQPLQFLPFSLVTNIVFMKDQHKVVHNYEVFGKLHTNFYKNVLLCSFWSPVVAVGSLIYGMSQFCTFRGWRFSICFPAKNS